MDWGPEAVDLMGGISGILLRIGISRFWPYSLIAVGIEAEFRPPFTEHQTGVATHSRMAV